MKMSSIGVRIAFLLCLHLAASLPSRSADNKGYPAAAANYKSTLQMPAAKQDVDPEALNLLKESAMTILALSSYKAQFSTQGDIVKVLDPGGDADEGRVVVSKPNFPKNEFGSKIRSPQKEVTYSGLLLPGVRAPDFIGAGITGAGIDGNVMTLAYLKGTVVALNFWNRFSSDLLEDNQKTVVALKAEGLPVALLCVADESDEAEFIPWVKANASKFGNVRFLLAKPIPPLGSVAIGKVTEAYSVAARASTSAVYVIGKDGFVKTGRTDGHIEAAIRTACNSEAVKGKELSANSVDQGGKHLQTFTNSIGMAFVKVPSGTFRMGLKGLAEPIHAVSLSSFWIGQYEVTNDQFEKFRARPRPSESLLGNEPATRIKWQDAVDFCAWLSRREGRKYRLPTEAEWEFAARGGLDQQLYPWGNEKDFTGRANLNFQKLMVVGSFAPNRYGLFDMAGNAWEFVSDYYEERYSPSPGHNPTGPQHLPKASYKTLHIERGGSFLVWQGYCGLRDLSDDDVPIDPHKFGDISQADGSGFRVVLVKK